MKKLKAMLILLTVFILFSFSGKGVCAKSQAYYTSRFLKYYKAGKYSKARKNYNKLKRYASEKCVKKMPKRIKKAYKKVINKFRQYDDESSKFLNDYYFTDFTNNGKAELILMLGPSYSAPKTMVIYKYKKGKAVKMGSRESHHETLHAYPGKKGIIIIDGVNAVEDVNVLYSSNGEYKIRHYGTRYLTDPDWFYGHGMLKSYN